MCLTSDTLDIIGRSGEVQCRWNRIVLIASFTTRQPNYPSSPHGSAVEANEYWRVAVPSLARYCDMTKHSHNYSLAQSYRPYFNEQRNKYSVGTIWLTGTQAFVAYGTLTWVQGLGSRELRCDRLILGRFLERRFPRAWL